MWTTPTVRPDPDDAARTGQAGGLDDASTVTRISSLIAPELVRGRADEIVQRIGEAIHLGLLNDGERLPNESDLAAQFGVAAMTIRESLATLRGEGLVETRRGRSGGSFVKRPREAPIELSRRRLAAMTISDLRDFADEHQAVSGQAAMLAAERASPANVRRLFALTEQLGTASSQIDRIRADSRFHIQLAIATQSIRLTRREVSLQAEISGLLWLPPIAEDELAAAVQSHHAIAAAVLAEDRSLARSLAEEHISANLRRVTRLRLQALDGDNPSNDAP